MQNISRATLTTCFALLLLLPWISHARSTQSNSPEVPGPIKAVKVKTEVVTFKGRKALRVLDAAPEGSGDEGRFVILPATDFQDGTIEVDLTGEPGPGASDTAIGPGTVAHFANLRVTPRL